MPWCHRWLLDDPRKAYKPLVHPLQGYYRLTYGRFRAIYSVEEEKLADGNSLIYIRVRFIAVGMRKERDRNDIYAIAKKLVEMGVIPIEDDADDEDLISSEPEPLS